MKNIYIVAVIWMIFASCSKDYQLQTSFSAPTQLNSPGVVNIDVNSGSLVTLSWTGGGTPDSSYVTYEVLFDKPGGNFSNPLYKSFSDNGAFTHLTVSHAILNSIARSAGIKPENSGEIIWTVNASKGGQTQSSGISQTMQIKRGEGIDNMPANLFLFGSGNENNGTTGLPFRKAAEGVYIIYTKVMSSGMLLLRGGTDANATQYFATAEGKLKEGDQATTLIPNVNPYRITVDFNTLSLKVENISDIRAIWGATYGVIGNLLYIGNGRFRADNCRIMFIDKSRPETNPPSWLGWTEERYYFIAKVNGKELCWGRKDNVSPERPTGSEPLSFYELQEFPWSQWDHLWKMKGDLDLKKATITIDTNLEGMMVHQFSNISAL